MRDPLISIITVNFNQPEVTCALLDSLRKQDYTALDVWVVDNGSKQDPSELFIKGYPEINYLRSDQNLGFAGGNNLALEHTKGDYLFFVNNDTEIPTGAIRRLVDLFQEVPNLGMASPLLCYYPQPGWTVDRIQYAGMTPVHPLTARNRTVGQGEEDKGQFAQPGPTAYAHGAAMMTPRRVLETVGPMADDFFLYYEELDWSARIRNAGFDIWVDPRAKIYHKESMAVSKMGALKTYYLNRNRIFFMRRNHAGWQLALFVLFLVFVTVPKQTALFALRREWANLGAFRDALLWHLWPNRKYRYELKPSRPAASPVITTV